MANKQAKDAGAAIRAQYAANLMAANPANTKEADKQAAQQRAALAQRMAEVQPVAEEIALAVLSVEDAAEGMSALIIAARCSGFTWDELEAAPLKGKGFPEVSGRGGKPRPMSLKDLPAYRKIKSRLNKLADKGVTLEPDMTTADIKAAIKEPRKAQSDGESDGDSTSTPGADKPLQFTDKVSVVKAALACLTEDASMRAAFPQEIRAVARALANDEAAAKAAQEPAPLKTGTNG